MVGGCVSKNKKMKSEVPLPILLLKLERGVDRTRV